MKLYVHDLIKAVKDIAPITSYLDSKKSRHLIVEELGLFEISDEDNHYGRTLWRLGITDVPKEEIVLGTVGLIIDRSSVRRAEEWFQISPYHHQITSEVSTFSLRPKAIVSLVVEAGMDGIIRDVYFSTEEDPRMSGVKDDVLTFLSLLKFC
jgi:hypothetical protein